MRCRQYRIHGRVQGVWFRESTRRVAVQLGISGYARNMPDGTVEVLACGGPQQLDRLSEWLQEGPPMAEVDEVHSEDVDSECADAFFTR